MQQRFNRKNKQKVTGVVKDIAGDPIIGASIIEKGSSSNGTITNVNGDFSLIVTGNELQVSYIGYIPQTINLKPGVSSYNVIMKEDTKTLDEVVVVGYSTQKKESLTGALQTVKSDKLKDITTPSVENMLNWKGSGSICSSRVGTTRVRRSCRDSWASNFKWDHCSIMGY